MFRHTLYRLVVKICLSGERFYFSVSEQKVTFKAAIFESKVGLNEISMVVNLLVINHNHAYFTFE